MDTSMTKNRFIETLHSERTSWEALLAEVDEAHMTQAGVQGEWSIKDIIAHVASYEEWISATLQRVLGGERPLPVSVEDMDLHQRNARIFALHQQRSLPEVRAFSQQAFQNLLTVVQSFSEEDLLSRPPHFKDLLPPFWPDELLWETIAGNSYEHYHEHIPDIRAWLSTLK
jgi:Protein of unknown function (DUF1706)